MRTLALFLTAAVALSAMPVRAEEVVVTQQRGFLSGLGVGLLVGGFVGLGAGVGGVVGANDSAAKIAAYGGLVGPADQASVDALKARLGGSTALAVVGLVGGGLALAGGILCLVIDSPKASIAFMPTTQGGVFVFSGRF